MVCHEKVVKMPWVQGDDVAKTVFRMRNGHVEVYGYAFWVNQCTSGFHRVNEPERKLSRCGRNQMGNESILALPKGADDFVVYYDARSKDLEACLEKGEGDCLLTNRWLCMKKDIASCGSKYLAYSEVEVEYQGSSGLLLQPELPEVPNVESEEDTEEDPKEDSEEEEESKKKWLKEALETKAEELEDTCERNIRPKLDSPCNNHDLSRLDNQSIERDRLIGIGFVLNFVKFISFTFGDKEMISVIEAVSR
ncbi:hypothetical protein Tco_0226989 [Tanacetum coccineum]